MKANELVLVQGMADTGVFPQDARDIHSFIGSSLISPDTPFYELEGGTAVLPDALR